MNKAQLIVTPRMGINLDEAAQDTMLSWGARGLLAYLLSSHTARISLRKLRATTTKDGTRRYVSELYRAGYVDVATEGAP